MILNLDADLREHAIRGTPMFPCEAYYYNISSEQRWEAPWHWHRELELDLVLDGAMIVEFDGSRHTVSAGEGVFINSNTMHFSFIPEGGRCESVTFVLFPEVITGSSGSIFEQKYILPLIESHCIPGIHLTPNSEWQKNAINCIEETHRHYREPTYGYEFLVREALTKVFYHIVLGMRDQIERPKYLSESVETRRVKRMLEYIHEHYTEPIDPAAIARAANVSERECFRSFKKTIGQTPVTYLQKYRVSIAAKLLAETKESVTEICYAVGFQSTSYFSKTFKQYMRMTPREYRASGQMARIEIIENHAVL